MHNKLPKALGERLRGAPPAAGLPSPRATGSTHVLYVLRTCCRSEGNYSLEVALRIAAMLDLPLVCLAVVEDSFPPTMCGGLARPRAPTVRAATFQLEGLQQLQPAFVNRGTQLLVHVERDGCRAAVAMSLASRAALVVTDEHYGVEPHAAATARLARTGAPLWLCDCHCTVPSILLPAAALAGGNAGFLRATQEARAERLMDTWFPPSAPPPPRQPPVAPAWSIDLSVDGAIESVLALPSRRDASVAPVRHTRGGQKAALARWRGYVSGRGLQGYAQHRNNPLSAEGRGASRMSAYVNAGMIDPHLMAREALAARADKFLSEFVGFREAPYLWCLRHPGGYSDASVAVPVWARGQLRTAEGLGRPGVGPPLNDLERGHSGDALWDDCQRCLMLSGEMHNNVRMAWGKAIPAWHAAVLPVVVSGAGAPSAAQRLQAALELLIYLNDKFALDGGAPPSYGGLLWVSRLARSPWRRWPPHTTPHQRPQPPHQRR